MKKSFFILTCLCFSIILGASQCSNQEQSAILNPQNTNQETMNQTPPNPSEIINKETDYQIINTYPHDPQAFTQGLIYDNNFLYEGTGLNGQSSVRKVNLETGEILQKYSLPEEYFGEGITIFNNKIIQLTWRSQKGFIYNLETFEKIGEFSYPTEGWGITHDNQYLIMSDGSENLYFLDPETFTEVKTIKVNYQNRYIRRINELEYINGEIFANVWLTDKIIRINPETGEVKGFLDFKQLVDREPDLSDNVLNGIAYNPENNHLYITGKLWSNLYEIKLNN